MWFLNITLCLIAALFAVTNSQMAYSTFPSPCSSCLINGGAWCKDPYYQFTRCEPRAERLVRLGCSNSSVVTSLEPHVPEVIITKADPLSEGRPACPQRALVKLSQGVSETVGVELLVSQGSSQLLLRVTSKPGIKATLESESTCNYTGTALQRRKQTYLDCTGLEAGSTISVNISVTLLSCIGATRTTLKLFNRDDRELIVKVDVEKLCHPEKCPCDSQESIDGCSGHGTQRCGVCDCDDGYQGQNCECGLSDDLCRNPNSTSGALCSGQGRCVCGSCACLTRRGVQQYSGRYCECDDFSCPYENHRFCGGHGVCHCGSCKCDEGYTGSACECSVSTEACRGANGLICNGRGSCDCGSCKCDVISNSTIAGCEGCSNEREIQRYPGPYCECDACPYENHQLCGGHGSCNCGVCECDEGYTGKTCDCPLSTDACRAENGLFCNNQGSCRCGKCDCYVTSGCSGSTCEDCQEGDLECHFHGKLDINGVCTCDDGYYGYKCECDNAIATPDMCRNPNSTDLVDCSGRGRCKCGQCSCYTYRGQQYYSGRYCQCDDTTCPYNQHNQRCGGHGTCRCGVCECHAGYSGEACDCPYHFMNCRAWNGLICNGHGTCDCDVCQCDPASNCTGPTCEDCPASAIVCLGGKNVNGVCVCDDDHYGDQCQCHRRHGAMELCRNPNSTSDVYCSGHGTCYCGGCICDHGVENRYSGRYCQCEDRCPYHNGRTCGGNGKCDCGECRCDPGYTGEACDCALSSDSCIAPNGLMCNDKGTCECGRCECYPDGNYVGRTCDIVSTDWCGRYRDCVQCYPFRKSSISACFQECLTQGVSAVDVIWEVNVPDRLPGNFCQVNDAEEDCLIRFHYVFKDNATTIYVQGDKVCP